MTINSLYRIFETNRIKYARYAFTVLALFMLLSLCSCANSGKPAATVKLLLTPESGVTWSEIGPGSVLELADGVYKSALIVRAQGTAEAPIVIKAAEGARPVAHNSLVFTDAAYVRVEGLTISDITKPGVIVRNESHHVTLSDSVVRNTAMGIWITGDAGVSNRFENNIIEGNRTHGIAVDLVNAKPGQETTITGNTISNNGYHGIEINGSYYIIEENEVFDNGKTLPGTSGIHVFSKKKSEDSGDYNIIRYNRTYRNIETSGPDGNGIQLDHWCDHNQIYYNLAYENDGPGISIFDAANNIISHNTVYSNLRDPGKDHPYPGELILVSDTESKTDRVTNIILTSNILVATRAGISALFVGPSTVDNALDISSNIFFHQSGSPVLNWAWSEINDSFELGSVDNGRLEGNVIDNPLFIKNQPSKMSDFRLQANSVAIGAGPGSAFNRDLLGTSLPGNQAVDIGAIQFSTVK